MKKICEFVAKVETEVEEPQLTCGADGKEIKALVKVKKIKEEKYFIAKPTRTLRDEAEIFYAAQVSKCVSAGIMLTSLLEKRFLNDGGLLSEEQRKEKENLEKLLQTQREEYTTLSTKENKTQEDEGAAKTKFEEMVDTMTRLQFIQNVISSILSKNSAETIATNRTWFWYALHLSYKEENGKSIPFFGEGNLDKKLAAFDEIENSEDPNKVTILEKLLLATQLWFTNQAETQEDFDIHFERYDKNA